MEKISDIIAIHPFFKGMSDEHVELLAGCGTNEHFKKGEILLSEGEDANLFYVIRKGRVALEIDGIQRGKIIIQTIQEDDILGWSWLIPPHYWKFTAVAVADTNAIALDGTCLRAKCSEDHELGYELLKRFSTVLAERLEATRLQLLDVYGVHS